jgi:putative sterol carrier protein
MATSAPCSLDDAVDWLRKRFDAEMARGVSAVYGLDLTGSGGGALTLRIEDGALELARSLDPDAEVVFHMAASDYFRVLAGQENPDLLYMAGRIEIDGDLSRAFKIRTLFRQG